MQSEEFSREIAYLKSPASFNETPKLVSKLNLFLGQKDLIRSKGKIEKNVDLKYDDVNPLVMAKNHHLTKLPIHYAHCQSMHMGLQSTLNYLRIQGMWILKSRQGVSSVISDCIVCKRCNAHLQKYPGPAILPSPRVKSSVTFAHVRGALSYMPWYQYLYLFFFWGGGGVGPIFWARTTASLYLVFLFIF